MIDILLTLALAADYPTSRHHFTSDEKEVAAPKEEKPKEKLKEEEDPSEEAERKSRISKHEEMRRKVSEKNKEILSSLSKNKSIISELNESKFEKSEPDSLEKHEKKGQKETIKVPTLKRTKSLPVEFSQEKQNFDKELKEEKEEKEAKKAFIKEKNDFVLPNEYTISEE